MASLSSGRLCPLQSLSQLTVDQTVEGRPFRPPVRAMSIHLSSGRDKSTVLIDSFLFGVTARQRFFFVPPSRRAFEVIGVAISTRRGNVLVTVCARPLRSELRIESARSHVDLVQRDRSRDTGHGQYEYRYDRVLLPNEAEIGRGASSALTA